MLKRVVMKISSLIVIGYFCFLIITKIGREIMIISEKSGMVHYGIIIRGYECLSVLSAIGGFILIWLVIKLVNWILIDYENEVENDSKEQAVE